MTHPRTCALPFARRALRPVATLATVAVLLGLTVALPRSVSAQATDAAAGTAAGGDLAIQRAGERLLAAYPDHLAAVEGGTLVWRDGARMPLDDGRGVKSAPQWLQQPDLEDMLQYPYAAGALAGPPQQDPGRARNGDFFARMYGDCTKGGVTANLVDVVWLPRKYGKRLKVTRINGVADRLTAAIEDLDQLPASFDRYLLPPAGSYVCRHIAGTNRVSAHGYGIAIDIATAPSDYWRWPLPKADAGPAPWRNRIPIEIITIFEKHGFIWGGKWRHFDTMHFEYRPELLPPTR